MSDFIHQINKTSVYQLSIFVQSAKMIWETILVLYSWLHSFVVNGTVFNIWTRPFLTVFIWYFNFWLCLLILIDFWWVFRAEENSTNYISKLNYVLQSLCCNSPCKDSQSIVLLTHVITTRDQLAFMWVTPKTY